MRIGDYEEVTKDGAAFTKGLMMVRERLGKPTDCSVASGWVMMDNIVQVWMKCWPQEVDQFIAELKDQLSAERTVKEALKKDGGYFPISYPMGLLQLTKTLLPQQKMNDKRFIRSMTQRYPFLKSTNYKL